MTDDPNDAQVARTPGGAAPRPKSATTSFGSPGSDSTVKRIDLNDALIRHPEATFTTRARGDAMQADGIDNGDVLLVDRAIEARHGMVVIAVVGSELVCRRLQIDGKSARLVASSPDVAPILITEDSPLQVWGVVTTVIKSLLP